MGNTDRLKLNKYIFNSIKKRFPNLEIHVESIPLNYNVIKKSVVLVDSKKITGIPVSIGYRGKDSIEGRVYNIEKLTPSVVFQENINGKILYIGSIDKAEKLRYLLNFKPVSVIINTEIKRPIFIKDYPVIYIPSILKDNEVKIHLQLEKKEEITRNIYFDIGYGAYFLFLVFPYDSRYQTKDSLDFYGSFQVTKELIRRLLEVKKPSGYRIRVIFTDYKYIDYLPLKEHLKKIDPDLILAVINTENSGLGNEKLILKTDKHIIDSFHFNRIYELFRQMDIPFKTDRYSGFYFPDLKVPVVWFSSQPNGNLYSLKKEFLSKKLIENFASNLFYIMNNLYKGIG
ncbi:hypothetical protein [Persephonella sp.]